jgi:hypothetical protein
MTPAGPDAWTTAEAADCAVVDPAAFRAVTLTRILRPTSAAASLYSALVAPEIGANVVPGELERCHWYANVIGAAPVQVPAVAVSVAPSTIDPDTAGALVFAGALPPTTLVALDATVVEPDEFVAVTRTRMRKPASLPVSV